MNEYVFYKTGGKCMNCCGYYLIGNGPPSLKKLRRGKGEMTVPARALHVKPTCTTKDTGADHLRQTAG